MIRFWIDIPESVSYGNLGAYLRGWLTGFNREPKHRNPFRNNGRSSAWDAGWSAGQSELQGEMTWRRLGRHTSAHPYATERQQLIEDLNFARERQAALEVQVNELQQALEAGLSPEAGRASGAPTPDPAGTAADQKEIDR